MSMRDMFLRFQRIASVMNILDVFRLRQLPELWQDFPALKNAQRHGYRQHSKDKIIIHTDPKKIPRGILPKYSQPAYM